MAIPSPGSANHAKVLLPKFAGDAEGRERFLREARAVAKLSHPHVVAGIDVGEIDGIYYFAMEFLDGESMDLTLCCCGRLLEWREATKIVRQIALALEQAQTFDQPVAVTPSSS